MGATVDRTPLQIAEDRPSGVKADSGLAFSRASSLRRRVAMYLECISRYAVIASCKGHGCDARIDAWR